MKILDQMTSGQDPISVSYPELEALETFREFHDRVCHGEALDDEEKAELRRAWSIISDKPFPADDAALGEAVEVVGVDSEFEIPF